MARNEQLIKEIIDNLAHGLYTSKDQAIADLVEAGLTLEAATKNVNLMADVSVMGIELYAPSVSCFSKTQVGQTCEDRIRQLRLLGYI